MNIQVLGHVEGLLRESSRRPSSACWLLAHDAVGKIIKSGLRLLKKEE